MNGIYVFNGSDTFMTVVILRSLGYRFIWRRPDDSLQAAMGHARIQSASDIFRLIHIATEAGWFIIAES
jgi:hypothetical protein